MKKMTIWEQISIGTLVTVITVIVVTAMYAQKLRSDVDHLEVKVDENKADVQKDIAEIKDDTKEIKRLLYRIFREEKGR